MERTKTYDAVVETMVYHLVHFESEREYTGEEIRDIAKELYFSRNRKNYDENSEILKDKEINIERSYIDYNVASDLIIAGYNRDFELIENLKTLDHIRELEDNWNGYGAERFSYGLIEMCKEVIAQFYVQPEISPTGRDSIQMEWELTDGSYLEFEIWEDKIGCLIVPYRNYDEAKEFFVKIEELGGIVEKFFDGVFVDNSVDNVDNVESFPQGE